ncbi:MAG: hypothetical protein ACOCTH_01095, partial [Halodesulfurarchaeum sp.]
DDDNGDDDNGDDEIPEGAEIIVMDPGGGNVLTVEAVSQRDDIDRELEQGMAKTSARESAKSNAEPEET